MGDRTEHPPLSIFIADEKRLAVRHVGRSVSFLVHVALHHREHFVVDRILGIHEHGTLIIHDIAGVTVRQFREDLLSRPIQGELGNTVAAVVVLQVDGLRPVDPHTRIVGRIRKQIGPRADADSPAAVPDKRLDPFHILRAQIEILRAPPATRHDDGVQTVEAAGRDVGRADEASAHLLVEPDRIEGFPFTGLGAPVSGEHADVDGGFRQDSGVGFRRPVAGGKEKGRHGNCQQALPGKKFLFVHGKIIV